MRDDKIKEVEVSTKIEKKVTPKKGKVGQPASKNPKIKKILASFTPEEHEQLQMYADSADRSLSYIARRELLKLIDIQV